MLRFQEQLEESAEEDARQRDRKGSSGDSSAGLSLAQAYGVYFWTLPVPSPNSDVCVCSNCSKTQRNLSHQDLQGGRQADDEVCW